jgi:SpoVK/Ycf46/Vps4 family AAA+-type ATPase
VFEDFDTSFDGREPLTDHKALTFDCILNQISGVQNKGGILLFVTTNRPDKIDSAMGNFSNIDTGDTGIEISTRPGRLDVAVHIGPLNEKNRRILATKTLRDWPDLIEKSLSIPGEFTPPQFEEICIQLAMRRIREQPNLLPTLIN